jgi:arylsulfatase A-like enzyme
VQQDNGVSGNFGLRAGEWKLVRLKKPGRTQAVVSLGKRPAEAPLHALYHLPTDPGELRDVGAEHPEKLRELVAQLDAVLAVEGSR